MVYTSILQYLETGTSIKDKIDRLDVIILSMMDAVGRSVLSGEFSEYRYDDGHSKIDVIYRDIKALTKTIEDLRHLQMLFRNDFERNVNGRVVRLVDGKNMTYYGNYR